MRGRGCDVRSQLLREKSGKESGFASYFSFRSSNMAAPGIFLRCIYTIVFLHFMCYLFKQTLYPDLRQSYT